MPASQKPYRLTATRVLDLIKNDTLTVEEYARSLLERIKDRDETVKAWAYLDPDFVIRQAQALDKISHDQRGPLHGVAVGIKDVINTKDMPTEFGSPIYKGHQPGFDSSAVAILRAAGALIFGKTTTTEFCVTNSGPATTNPHDPNRTPGGSSCGSAAAVADLQVPLSIGAQTGGSVIRPASFTGVFALKPTYGLVSPEGTKVYSNTFDTLGFFARSIDDLQLVADVFAIRDDQAPQDIPLKDASVALVKTPMWPRAGPGTVVAMEKAAAILRASGVRVDEVSLPAEIGDGDALKRIQKVVMSLEAQVAFLREYRVDREGLDPEIRDFVENKSNFTQKELAQSVDGLAALRLVVDEMAGKYSAIITPSVVDEAPLGLDDMGSAAFNTLWTGFHMPVLNIPAFEGAHDMPVGISLVATRFHDQHLLRVGKTLGELLMAQGDWKVDKD